MSFLDYIDDIPGKIFPRLKSRMVDGYLYFPHKLYREFFHILGSFLIISFSYILYLYVSVYVPVIIFLLWSAWMTYQEFYLHPKKYNQKLLESILDWSSWIIPLIIYLVILY